MRRERSEEGAIAMKRGMLSGAIAVRSNCCEEQLQCCEEGMLLGAIAVRSICCDE